MGMKAVLDVWAGYALDGSSVPEDDLEPYIQEVLNELEYLMGDTSTEYGKLRAQHGREEPFEIPYIEIGNEDFFSTTYEYRYRAFYDAITAKYPDATIISTAYQESRPYDLIDDHFYVSSMLFYLELGKCSHQVSWTGHQRWNDWQVQLLW